MSDPCCRKLPRANHMEFSSVNTFSSSSGSGSQGCGLAHSFGAILRIGGEKPTKCQAFKKNSPIYINKTTQYIEKMRKNENKKVR